MCVQVLGVPVGYSSPNTMTDMSSAIKRGDKAANTITRTHINNEAELSLTACCALQCVCGESGGAGGHEPAAAHPHVLRAPRPHQDTEGGQPLPSPILTSASTLYLEPAGGCQQARPRLPEGVQPAVRVQAGLGQGGVHHAHPLQVVRDIS